MASNTLVTLVGGAFVDPGDLEWAVTRAPFIVAADGGADQLLGKRFMPQAVIGDMDSLSLAARAAIPSDRLHRVATQDTTDFEKCLTAIDAPGVIGLGFLGGRLDHSLATLAVLARRRARCLLVGPEDVAFVAPERVKLNLEPGTRVSLFPFAPITGRSKGLVWPIDGLKLAPDGMIGTSNRATGPVELEAEGIVVLLPRAARQAAFDAVLAKF